MSIFSRTKGNTANTVNIADPRIVDLITNWCRMRGDSINVFLRLLTGINGITTPVTLDQFNEEKRSVVCTTADGSIFSLTFAVNELHVKHRNPLHPNDTTLNIYEYTIWGADPCLTPKVFHIEQNGNILRHALFEAVQLYQLALLSGYGVTVEVREPTELVSDIRLIGSRSCIRDYMLKLAFPCEASDIYKEIVGLYGFDKNLLPLVESINVYVTASTAEKTPEPINYLFSDNTDKITLSKFIVKRGKVVEYGTSDEDASYSITSSGDWSCSTQYADVHADVHYDAKTGDVSIGINAPMSSVDSICKTIIPKVLEKVNSIRDKVDPME